MTEQKWTKGPWIFDGTGPHKVFGCEISDSVGDCIAGSWHGKDETARANAHLIAAAPDLYEALEALEEEAAFYANDSADDDYMYPVTLNVKKYRAIVEALAKARGEQ